MHIKNIYCMVTVLALIVPVFACVPSEPPKGDEEPPPPPPPTACDDIVLRLVEDGAADADPCMWVGQTAAAPADRVQTCLVDPSVLSGTQTNPGIGNIEVRHNGNQIAFARTATGEGPWSLTLDSIDCNTAGTCGPWFDLAEYQLLVANPNRMACSDFGQITLTLDLKN